MITLMMKLKAARKKRGTIPWHLLEGNEENNKKETQSGQPVSSSKFKLNIS
jgi:hypothetical protein